MEYHESKLNKRDLLVTLLKKTQKTVRVFPRKDSEGLGLIISCLKKC